MRQRVARTALWACLLALAGPGTGRAAEIDTSPQPPYVPGRVVVKLRPELARAATSGLESGFVAATSSAGAASFDELCARYGVHDIRRVFRRLEDDRGELARTAGDAVHARLRERGARLGAALSARVETVPDLENVFVLDLADDGPFGAPEAVAAFQADENVVWAEPDYLYEVAAEPLPVVPFLPDDRYVTQDGLHWSAGAVSEDFPDLFGLRNIRALEGWNELDGDGSGGFDAGETPPGAGIVVAVIDTGVDPRHPDIEGNLWVNPGEIPGNRIDDDGNGMIDDVSGWDFIDDDARPDDPHGHGTHVAGTVAALAGNGGVGVAGVAPHARILPLRGLGASGGGSTTGLAAAIEYAVAIGAHITSNSWGGAGTSQLLTETFDAARAAGVLNIAAAGNQSIDVRFHSPANIDSVMAVAALDAFDLLAGFSNFGTGIEIAAPGVGVLSLNSRGGDNAIARARPERVVDVDYLVLSGTSMACPHVSGAAAVLMGAFPAEPAEEIRGRLLGGARNLDAENPGLVGQLGAGALDLFASLRATPAPVLRLHDSSASGVVPGGQAEVVVALRNGWRSATGVTLELSTAHPSARVDRGRVDLAALSTGEIGDNASEPFLVSIAPDASFGKIPFSVEVEADGGVRASFSFSIAVSFLSDVTFGAGVSEGGLLPKFSLFQDHTGDGLPDLLAADLVFDVFLYENQGDGAFRRRNRGIFSGFNAWTSFFFDVENDGDRDVVVGGRARDGSILRLKQDDGRTVDASESSGMASFGLVWSTVFDYDGDGFLDVFGGKGDGKAPVHLLVNQGDGTFVDRREESGLPDHPFPGGIGRVVTLDHDDDGDADLLFASFESGLALWRNDGDGTFSEITDQALPGFAPPSVLGLEIGDCDNDGDEDLFVSDRPFVIDPPSRILRNEGGVFLDIGDAAGDVVAYNVTGLWWGNAFFDVDNDGDLDLYVPKDVSYRGSALPDVVRSPLFRNDGECRFTLISDVAFPAGLDTAGAAASLADYDADGDLDLYAPGSSLFASAGGLLRNEVGNRNHWLTVTLQGTVSAPDAIGARLTLEAGGKRQMRELRSGAVDPGVAHFGLGLETVVDRLEVRWPSGIHQVFHEVAADRRFDIVEVDCGAGRDVDGDGVCDPLEAVIDIRPLLESNPVRVGSPALLPVLLLGREGFRVEDVDRATLAFGPGGAPDLGAPWLRPRDLNGDRHRDLLGLFPIAETGIAFGDTEACLRGELADGVPFSGCDSVHTLPACGLGYELALLLPPLAWLRARRRRAR
ncbi:MAG: S8 family serine peptidase [Myxococcota bacterium]|nr:S8 family serine peptidase [Myxococcota bacterium]